MIKTPLKHLGNNIHSGLFSLEIVASVCGGGGLKETIKHQLNKEGYFYF